MADPAPITAITPRTQMVDEFLHEQLGLIGLHARMAQNYVEAGDLAGLTYSMRAMIARVKATAGVLNDIRRLHEHTQEGDADA